MTNKLINITLPTRQYYVDEVECRTGCPVHTDARGYLIATFEGRYKEGYAIARATNPFASICGKVCGAPCETACRRGDVDAPITIRSIKGFLTSQWGPETGDLKTPLTYATVRGSIDPELNGRSVGIIGGGVGGYTCAHDLARLGYACTIYERHAQSGGMLIQGVPINRLSRQVVQAELDSILEFKHIQVEHNCEVGKDISFAEIRARHDAVFIAVGLGEGRMLPLEHADHKDVHPGLKFLFDFNCGTPWDLDGCKCLVIGGGDVAFDVARSALRSQAPVVNLCCLERDALHEMPGSADEREGGRREGVIINDGWGPDEIVVENGKLKGLKIKKVKRVFDEDHRFSPEFLEETRFIEADKIFMAVGQQADLSFLEGSGVRISRRGLIECEPPTFATNVEGVYAGGDVALGPRLFINAIASASDAALAIDAHLSKTSRQQKLRRLGFTEMHTYHRREHYLLDDRCERSELDVDPAAQPHVLGTVEYSHEAARVQAYRCLMCHIHPTFEGDICILCGGCVDVCPSYCLSMKTLDRLAASAEVDALVAQEFGTTQVAARDCSVMLFDPLKCIRCGMCAIKCPTGACKMSENDFVDCYIPAD